MAVTTIDVNQAAFTGEPLYIKIENSAGLIWNGTAMVAYVLANLATYAKAMTESPAGSGRFTFNFAALGLPVDDYTWTICNCLGGAPVGTNANISDPQYGNGGDHWDGTTLGPVTAGGATDPALLGLFVAGTITDPAPTSRSFVVTPADGDAVPDEPDWVSLYFCLTSGGRKQAKRTITAYRKITTTTALVTVGSPYATAPANGDSWTII